MTANDLILLASVAFLGIMLGLASYHASEAAKNSRKDRDR